MTRTTSVGSAGTFPLGHLLRNTQSKYLIDPRFLFTYLHLQGHQRSDVSRGLLGSLDQGHSSTAQWSYLV